MLYFSACFNPLSMNGLSHSLFSARVSHFIIKISIMGMTPAKTGVFSFESICWTSCGPWVMFCESVHYVLTLRTRPKSISTSHSISDNRKCLRSLSRLFKKRINRLLCAKLVKHHEICFENLWVISQWTAWSCGRCCPTESSHLEEVTFLCGTT